MANNYNKDTFELNNFIIKFFFWPIIEFAITNHHFYLYYI
jgi:hypothetical protein